MRILKYISLLLLLSVVAASIFIATQKSDFTVERSKIIKSPRSAVYSYVNDYRNWADFGSWTTDAPEIKVLYPETTIGKGAYYSWKGNDGMGEVRTLYVKENDSISQKMNYNGTSSAISWSFKDTEDGTKVTWQSKGNMSFLLKFYTALNGGVEEVIGKMYEKSLENLDKALDYEINTFSIKVNGIVKKPQSFYLAQTFTSELIKIDKNTEIVIPTILAFCDKNDITVSGKPFVIYHTYDMVKGLAKISICIPIKKEIFISPGSDLISGKLEASEGVKTTVIGDYSHIKKGYNETLEFVTKNQLTVDPLISHIEIYSTGKTEAKHPSKWVTEIYVPVLSEITAVKAYTPAPVKVPVITTDATATNAIEPVKIKKPVVKSIEAKKLPKQKGTEDDSSEF
jgi:effector-binding domain-containing protein